VADLRDALDGAAELVPAVATAAGAGEAVA
jgi:hypothetical protein